MKFRKATAKYEAWLGRHLNLLEPDLAAKHDAMREIKFSFLRATYYRWAQVFPKICDKLSGAVRVLAVGDLHVENFGTWRDAEGRLAWGVNDFDEAAPLPYTHDLVRLAASANMAIEEHRLRLDPREAAEGILEGYVDALKTGGREFVLAEGHPVLYQMALHRLREPEAFWRKFERLPTMESGVPASAVRVMKSMFPAAGVPQTVERMRAAGEPVSASVAKLLGAGGTSWYRDNGRECFNVVTGSYQPVVKAEGIARVADFKASHGVVRKNPGASLVDLGDGVACLELHSKKNAIGEDIVRLMTDTLRPDSEAVRKF